MAAGCRIPCFSTGSSARSSIAKPIGAEQALFAHCVALSVNAVHESWNRRPHALAHADRLAEAVDLDMAAAGWSPTIDNYLGRVTKPRILQAVREAKGDHAAQLIEHLNKGEMAERLKSCLPALAGCPNRRVCHAGQWRPHPRSIPSRPPKMRRSRRYRTQSRPNSEGSNPSHLGPAGNGGPSSSRSLAHVHATFRSHAPPCRKRGSTVPPLPLEWATRRPLLDRRRCSQYGRPIHVRSPQRI
jgi:hypothetical protein